MRLRQRLISAAVLVPVVLVVFLLGHPWLTLGIAALSAAAAWELSGLIARAGLANDRWLAVATAAAAPFAFHLLVPAWSFEARPDLHVGAAVAFVFLVVVVTGAVSLRRGDPALGFRNWVGTTLAALYASLLASVVGIVLLNPGIAEDAFLDGRLDGGRTWLLVLVLSVWALDSFAYIAGRYHGRGRFMNHISPNKTWSGVIGGTAAGVLVCTLLVWAAGQHPLGGIALGLVISVAAQLGDLAESMLKRAAKAKESGTLLPGHGGILDRVDSFLFAGPAMLLTIVVSQALLEP